MDGGASSGVGLKHLLNEGGSHGVDVLEQTGRAISHVTKPHGQLAQGLQPIPHAAPGITGQSATTNNASPPLSFAELTSMRMVILFPLETQMELRFVPELVLA